MAIGDLLMGLMGQPNPQQQIAQALGQYPGQAGSRSGPAPGPGAGAAAPGLAQAGGGANSPPQPPQQQQPPPQPQAYQTPPDLGQLYMQLMQRQQANQSINTGLGLLAGAFSHNQQDRDNMIGAMSDLNKNMPSAGDQMSTMASLQQTMWQRQMLMQQLQNAPIYAKQLNMPVEQVQAYIQAGKLPELMTEVERQHLVQADPLHIAQTAEAGATTAKTTAETGVIPITTAKTQAETDEARARIAAIPATTAKTIAETAAIAPNIAKTQAETAAIPITTAKTAAETAAIPITTAKTAAETAAIPGTMAKTAAETQLAQQNTAKAAADAAARENLAKLTADPDFQAKYGITPAVAQSLPPEELAKLVATAPQVAATTTAKISTEDMATALAGLPSADLKAREAMDLADSVANDPGLSGRTGAWGVLPAIPGTNAATLQAKIDKLAGTSGVAAVDALKGGIGRILGSEFTESEHSQSLLNNQHISAADYKKGALDFKAKLGAQMALMYQKAGKPVPDYYKPYIPGATPQGPTVAAPKQKRRSYDANGNLQ